MIELQTLGALAIRAPDASSALDLYSRPKPFGLLAYLAASRPRGFQPQDALLVLFWPEADAVRAQQSLRQALHILRRALGAEVVARRGRAELGINERAITCDVVQFEQALACGNDEQALELYQGEFLPGVHVQDAPDFERWVSLERLRLAGMAVDSARRLMRACDETGDAAGAMQWARRWMALAPSDEAALQCVMTRHTENGEDGSAVKTFEHFAKSLAVDGEIASPATVQLVDDARERLGRIESLSMEQAFSDSRAPLSIHDRHRRVAANQATLAERFHPQYALDVLMPSAALDPTAPTPTDEPQPLNHDLTRAGDNSPPRATRWRRRWHAAAVASVLLGTSIAAIGPRRLVFAFKPRHTEIAASGTRIAVLPFSVRGDERLAYLREGMVDLLSGKLDNVDGLSTVNAGTVLAFERAHAPITDEPRAAREVARQLAAGQFVTGSVIEAGGLMAITASLFAADGRLIARTEASASNDAQIFPAVDRVARDLLASEFTGASARLEHVAATTTASLPALRAFLEGERATTAGQPSVAVDAYARAVREDSTFALAHYRLSTTVLWSSEPGLVQQSIAAAERFSRHLPQHERMTLQARAMIGRGDVEDADRLYRDIVAKNPDDVDSWNQLGESLFHTGPWRGRPVTDSRPEFEQVLARQPSNGSALLHLARLATLERRSADAASLIDRALALDPEREATLELRGLRAVATHDEIALQRLLDTIRASASVTGVDDAVRLVAWRVATYGDAPTEGAAIMATLLDVRSNIRLQLTGRAALAHMAAASGRWKTVQRELKLLAEVDEPSAAETRANLALAWPASLARAERMHLMHELAARADRSPAGSSAERDSMSRASRSYLAATLALANGDTAFARAQQRVLLALTKEPYAEADLAEHLAHQLSARILFRRGHAAEALRDVEAGWPHGSARAPLPFFQGDIYTQAHERFFRAELLMALGRNREAERWLQTVVDDQGEGLVLSARVHIALATIAEREGAEPRAIAQYQRAFSLWSNADASVMAAMRDTEAHLASMVERQAHPSQNMLSGILP
jgi:DNA-binding SARP family transcriptional activator/TolB-like protein